jgi:integrase/recombinase XerD
MGGLIMDRTYTDTVIMPKTELVPHEAPKKKTLDDYAREFLAPHHKSPRTLEAYAQDLRHFLDFTQGNLGDESLLIYQATVTGSMAPRSAARRLGVIKNFLDYLVYKEVLGKNLYGLLKKKLCPKIDKTDGPTIHLEDEEVRLMLQTPDTETLLGASQRMVFTLSFFLGLRVSEITSIRVGDIKGQILTIVGKGKKKRTLELGESVLDEVSSYLVKSGGYREGDDSFLVVTQKTLGKIPVHKDTINNWFKDVAERAGIKKHVTSHTGRATAATKLLDEGVSVRDTANMLGHSSLDTTMLYDKKRRIVSGKTTGKVKY